MTTSIKKSIKQPRTGSGQLPIVDFNKDDFTTFIEKKGYNCYIEKALPCPCRASNAAHQPLSSCKNCGGSGWIYINRTETKVLITSMNQQNKISEWSLEKLGMANMSFKDVDKIADNDRVTVIEVETYYSETLLSKYSELNDKEVEFAILSYPCKTVEFVFLYNNDTTKHTLLVENKDFIVLDNILTFTDKWSSSVNFGTQGNKIGKAISIRYKHQPVYHIVDITRDSMVTDIFVEVENGQKPFQMPIHAVGRRAHYLSDANSLKGAVTFDNSTF